MEKFFLLFVSFIICIQPIKTSADDNRFILGSNRELSSFENMTIIPIFTSLQYTYQNKLSYNIMNLKEAIEKKLIIISERAAANQGPAESGLNLPELSDTIEQSTAQYIDSTRSVTDSNSLNNAEMQALIAQSRTGLSDVNTLLVSNKSDKYIYLMAGDVVKGGRQDRVVAKDVIIPPNTEQMNLSVFCVEQNRWNYQGEQTDFGKFSNVVSNTVRNAVQVEQEQYTVWSKVSTVQSSAGVVSETGAYSDMESSQKFTLNRDRYIDFFSDVPDKYNNIIGIIVATGDSIIGCDIFLNHEVFKMQYPSLLHSYITDVICFGHKTKISYTKITGFFESALKEIQAPQEQNVKSVTRFYYNDKLMHFTKFK